MAERRMFAKSVIDSDEFLDLPIDAQCLYFHLAMRADDDGFITPKKIMRLIGAREDSLRVLIARRFIIPFDSGVIVIRHWRLNNYLQKDRYNETVYQEEKAQLVIEKGNPYELIDNAVNRDKPLTIEQVDTECIQDGYNMYTERIHSIGKDRLGKDRLGKEDSLHSSSCSEVCEEPSEPTTSDPVFIELLTNKMFETFEVRQSFVETMKGYYPAVDVEGELRKMAAWLVSNPKRRKTKKGMMSFINSWLAREQDKGKEARDTYPQPPQKQRINYVATSEELREDYERIKRDPRYKGDGDITMLI